MDADSDGERDDEADTAGEIVCVRERVAVGSALNERDTVEAPEVVADTRVETESRLDEEGERLVATVRDSVAPADGTLSGTLFCAVNDSEDGTLHELSESVFVAYTPNCTESPLAAWSAFEFTRLIEYCAPASRRTHWYIPSKLPTAPSVHFPVVHVPL
jgi:hypothetical protein